MKEQLDAIRGHGEETYPNECCGFLLGENTDGVNVVREIYRAENQWRDLPEAEKTRARESDDRKPESLENRYLITPQQWMDADRHARESRIGIIGYYHSHPDHPAIPSKFDLDHSCWPGESYIIVTVERGKAGVLNSFRKPDYTRFEPEEILAIG
jgi:proteasome lid subunit RPN8/RPN11